MFHRMLCLCVYWQSKHSSAESHVSNWLFIARSKHSSSRRSLCQQRHPTSHKSCQLRHQWNFVRVIWQVKVSFSFSELNIETSKEERKAYLFKHWCGLELDICYPTIKLKDTLNNCPRSIILQVYKNILFFKIFEKPKFD